MKIKKTLIQLVKNNPTIISIPPLSQSHHYLNTTIISIPPLSQYRHYLNPTIVFRVSGKGISIRSIIIIIIIIIIINIQGWTIWPVPSQELKLLSPSFL
jgi:hypothetical protein